MTDMPETIWAAIHPHGSMECIDYPVSYTTEYRRADLPPSREQVEAMVKPLVWEPCDTYRLKAWTELGFYNIDVDGHTWWAFMFENHGDDFEEWVNDEYVSDEEAIGILRAAAQADYTRRILAPLGYEANT